MIVVLLLFTVLRVCLQFVIVVFPIQQSLRHCLLNEFEWPSLKVCSVGIGVLSFSSIGFIVV